MNTLSYRGFTITVRTYMLRGSNRWTLELLIGRNRGLRSSSGSETFANESAAVSACLDRGRRIIDGKQRNCSVKDLT